MGIRRRELQDNTDIALKNSPTDGVELDLQGRLRITLIHCGGEQGYGPGGGPASARRLEGKSQRLTLPHKLQDAARLRQSGKHP